MGPPPPKAARFGIATPRAALPPASSHPVPQALQTKAAALEKELARANSLLAQRELQLSMQSREHLDRLTAERDAISARRDALSAERDALSVARDAAAADTAAAREALRALQAEALVRETGLAQAVAEADARVSVLEGQLRPDNRPAVGFVGDGADTQVSHVDAAPADPKADTTPHERAAAAALQREVTRLQAALVAAQASEAAAVAGETDQSNERTLRRLEQIRTLKAELAGVKAELSAARAELGAATAVAAQVEEARKARAAALREKTLAYVTQLREEQQMAVAEAAEAGHRAVTAKQAELDAYRAAAADEIARAQISLQAAERATGLEARSVRAALTAIAQAELKSVLGELRVLEAARDDATGGRASDPPRRDAVEVKLLQVERQEAVAAMRAVEQARPAAAAEPAAPPPVAPAQPALADGHGLSTAVGLAPYPGLFCSM